jgi:hypothetical protein
VADGKRERVADAAELPPIQFVAVCVLIHVALMRERQRPSVVWFLSERIVLFIDETFGTNVCSITRRSLEASARATLRAEPGEICRISHPRASLPQH